MKKSILMLTIALGVVSGLNAEGKRASKKGKRVCVNLSSLSASVQKIVQAASNKEKVARQAERAQNKNLKSKRSKQSRRKGHSTSRKKQNSNRRTNRTSRTSRS